MQNKLEAVEMWFYRRMMRITWIDHQSNKVVLRKAGTAFLKFSGQFEKHILLGNCTFCCSISTNDY